MINEKMQILLKPIIEAQSYDIDCDALEEFLSGKRIKEIYFSQDRVYIYFDSFRVIVCNKYDGDYTFPRGLITMNAATYDLRPLMGKTFSQMYISDVEIRTVSKTWSTECTANFNLNIKAESNYAVFECSMSTKLAVHSKELMLFKNNRELSKAMQVRLQF